MKKTITILSLLCIAWTWPTHWNPTGKPVTYSEQVVSRVNQSDLYLEWLVMYDNSTLVLYVFDHPLRPLSINHNVNEECKALWIDYAIMSPDGKKMLPRSQWKEASEWRLTQPTNPECKAKKEPNV